MKARDLAAELNALVAAGFGDREIVTMKNLAYERVTSIEYVSTIYRGQNPHEIPEPLVVMVTKPPTNTVTQK